MATIQNQTPEQRLFSAVDRNDIGEINTLIQGKVDINATIEKEKRTALQRAFFQGTLRVETCRCLIQNGIDLEHRDSASEKILPNVTAYYVSIKKYKTQCVNTSRFHFDEVSVLNLFQAILEGGADITSESPFHDSLGGRSVREEAARHPELEAIVMKTAQEVFSVLPGEWGITRIVCDYLSRDPGKKTITSLSLS